ncbi:transglycosylase SLT domain-containing protein [Pseudoduganella sp. FT93W]|uniref:Transglycosylase SLT domain-containing protein n=1 Tax=Duganella fentianensis TaxID=2692177 RepID=A0A845HWL8_9BURK|nr:transglycosylase SLT domain-containing protein [Duganella fentianensis]
MRDFVVGAGLVAVLAGVWYIARRATSQEVTAGDMEANAFTDTVDEMKTKITGWPAGSEPYQDLIQSAADDYAVPVQVLAALLWKESRYNPAIVDGSKRSPVGAMGIAQFMPATARQELGSESAALDPDQAVPGAARYLAKLYRSTGTWAQALAAYNWGIGNVQRKGLAAAPAETVDYYTTILGMAGLDTYA